MCAAVTPVDCSDDTIVYSLLYRRTFSVAVAVRGGGGSVDAQGPPALCGRTDRVGPGRRTVRGRCQSDRTEFGAVSVGALAGHSGTNQATAPTTTVSPPTATAGQEQAFWIMTSSGVRHNSRCRYFRNSNGPQPLTRQPRSSAVCLKDGKMASLPEVLADVLAFMVCRHRDSGGGNVLAASFRGTTCSRLRFLDSIPVTTDRCGAVGQSNADHCRALAAEPHLHHDASIPHSLAGCGPTLG